MAVGVARYLDHFLSTRKNKAGKDSAVWLPAVRVGLCGDWLQGGRVEDAWLSGRALAMSVMASVPLCSSETM